MAACPVLDLGGRTVDDPCPDAVLGVCSVEDFDETRGLEVIEHNALVRSLNAWNRLVAAGKTTWTPLPTAAWEVYEESWRLLSQYPAEYSDLYKGWKPNLDLLTLKAPIAALIAQAQRVHSAACDVDAALAAVGEPVPSKPTLPEEKKDVVAEVVDFARDTGRGILKIVALGVGGLLAYTVLSK